MTLTSESNSRVLYENLDTSFVNLWALLRYLSQRNFVGRVHVEIKDYTADVFLTGSNMPLVHEVDRAAGTDKVEEAALHRLVLRARESSGSISVIEGADEAVAVKAGAPATKTAATHSVAPMAERDQVTDEAAMGSIEQSHDHAQTGTSSPPSPVAVTSDLKARIVWNDVARVSGELIAAVERALGSGGADFPSLFRTARLGLADDYTFLDPTSGIEYKDSTVTAREELPISSYVAGLSEVLRRIVDNVATGERARRTRERVAVELSVTARKHYEVLKRSGFLLQLDGIAGTKVI
jgi:hypothetical protein